MTVVRAALVGGPMYDGLYERIPDFERETGMRVEVVVSLPHPELNAWVRRTFEAGATDIDLLSTHTKYAPSQARWLSALDDVVAADTIADVLPRPLELSRIDGRLLQVPRNLDVRLLHYRRDLIEKAPSTWTELADVAASLTTADRFGFLFPGRDSGLFGTFYELLVGAGGTLFDAALRPAFDSAAGEWAASFLTELHHVRRVTPRALARWHYDEISEAFRDGRSALVCDWPGSYHLYISPGTCSVADRVGLALLPEGPAGRRAAYAGCHSFAIPSGARNRPGGAALLRFLTSPESQLYEARAGAIPCRASVLAQIQGEAAHDARESTRWELLMASERMMIVPPRFAAYPDCEDAIWRSIQQAMEGRMSPAEAVHRAAVDVERVIASVPA
jgi:multiple sugar transport system substrate-binding protein